MAIAISIAAPEIFLLIMISIILLADLYLPKNSRGLVYVLTQVSLLFSTGILVYLWNLHTSFDFAGQFILDPLAILLKIGLCLAGFFAFCYGRAYNAAHHIPEGEFHILGLLSILGGMVLVSAASLLTVYLGLELLSLPLYALIGMRRDSLHAVEAAVKYFIMGAIGSGFLLYGFSLIYGLSGELRLDLILAHLSHTSLYDPVFLFGVMFIVAALGFKFGAVPFHAWVPDVYQGSPTSVSTFLATVPKIAALGMFLRVLSQTLPDWQMEWSQVLMILAVLSLFLGNVVAVVQTNIKRMLGYSAISHVGFIFLALSLGSVAGDRAALFYMLVYALSTAAAFGLLLLLTRQGVEADTWDDLRGMNQENSWFAFMMLLVMLSMAGIPPLVGFEAKFFVLQALFTQHHEGLVVYALLMSVVGAYYYIRIVKLMYFEGPVKGHHIKMNSPSALVMVSGNTLLVLVLGLLPSALYTLCGLAF